MTCWMNPTENQEKERAAERSRQLKQSGLRDKLNQMKSKVDESPTESTEQDFDWGKFGPGQSRQVGGGNS